MANVLIIDDGVSTRASKTRMYQLLSQSKGANVTMEKLQNLTDPKQLQGYDIVFADLDGQSVPDNQAFITLLDGAVQAGATPSVKMFSGYFSGASDLPVSLPPSLQGIVTTHSDTTAIAIIPATIAAIGQSRGGVSTPPRP